MKEGIKILASCLALGISAESLADFGPEISPLQVKTLYTVGGQVGVYVEFQIGSMPGCYGNAGGFLNTSNPFFKEIHATLLTMMATGGTRGQIAFAVTGPVGQWDRCTVQGVYLRPS